LAPSRLIWTHKPGVKRLEVKSLHLLVHAMGDFPRRLYHSTPGWVKDGALFHIRLRAALSQGSMIEPTPGFALLSAVRRYHDLGHWWCSLVLLMPDHMHAIIAFPSQPGMTVTVRNWKRGAHRFQSVQWQEGFFDHRLRNDDEVSGKWHYIRRNPVVRGLCAREDGWRCWWSSVMPNPLLEGGAA
jgi:putative transposase